MHMSVLGRHEGTGLYNAPQAVLKGIFETESEITLLTGPHASVFGSIKQLANDPAVATLIRQHNLHLAPVPTSSRGLTLALQTAITGGAALAIIPNQQLDDSMPELGRVGATLLDRGGSLAILLEDDPQSVPCTCPRQAAMRIKMPAIEVSDLEHLRDSIEQAMRLSRAGRSSVGIIVHRSILRSIDTLESRPNRLMGPVETALMRRRRPRSLRWTETGGVLRMARRMELNRFRAMPSPGERVSVGFIAVGPANAAILHLTHAFQLHGRVPVLMLGLIQPIDEPAVQRLLDRCQQVIVLEPRPGSVESWVLDVGERMRRKGDQPGNVWGRMLPAESDGIEHAMSADSDLHPSVLVRKIAHLLHAIRPTVQVTSHLTPEPPPLAVDVPPRETLVGSEAALATVRRMVTDVDQWLRERAPLQERGLAPTALSIDGVESVGKVERTVAVETWDHPRFQRDGIAAIIQAARDDRPCVFMVCEAADQEIRDLERFARGAIPAERADRVTLDTANINDRIGLRDALREATLVDRMTVLIVRDGPPARFDPAAMEQSLADIDRLGFEPQQRVIHPADEVCAIRPSVELHEQGPRNEHDSERMQTQFSMENLTSEEFPRFRLRVRPLLEEVEVVRTRPPRHAWHTESMARLAPPQLLHGKQSIWRAHLAGFRGDPPGAAASVLLEVGRIMGFHVRGCFDSTPVAPGHRAWSQVMFTHPRQGEDPLPVTAVIPFGEADLLLGIDVQETLRAIGAATDLRVAFGDRTFAVVQVDSAGDSPEQPTIVRSTLVSSVSAVSRGDVRMVEDFRAACRTWFHTDRVADLAMLGAAFQRGLIPASIEAMEAALFTIETRGFGRSREAFDFGRRLSVDPRLFVRPKDEREEDVNRLARRMVLSLSRREWGGGSRARRFHALIHGSLQVMPGLTETEHGRLARRDFVLALYRCVAWGGIDYAQTFADLVTRVYQADRGDRGRLLTRHVILPLAETMLVRDQIYIATMAASSEQRRLTRQRLNVKEARGDRLERRYLTRLELVAFNRRLRADVRSSDWPARVVAMGRRIIPKAWRGSVRERDLREYLIDLVNRAVDGADTDYERWTEAMTRLYEQAAEDRLRGMSLAEVRMLVEPVTQMRPAIIPAS